jgi:hypothetical protein
VTSQLPLSSPDLWVQRVDQLGLRIEDSPIGPLVEKLYLEMAEKGIELRPPCFVANEWGCPDGQPLIGIPFYLVDPRMHAFEEEHADDLEDASAILAGLRHEAGHAVNYAWRLWTDPEWCRLFGDFGKEYADDYRPCPFSTRFVRHLPGWYAQKHPDEDFAETFAVWLTPGLDWRARYAGTPALEKLEYLDRLMPRVGGTPPLVAPGLPDPDELDFTVGEFYADRHDEDAPPTEELEHKLDHDLRALFQAEGLGTDAAQLVWEKRKVLMRHVADYTGARMYVVRDLIRFVYGRLRELNLRAHHGREMDAMIGVTGMLATLTSSFLDRGSFL